MAVKLIIDSASDINEKEAQELGVILLPIEVRFNEEEYLDGVNLYPMQFYEKLIESDVLPQTSQISPYHFEEAYEKVVSQGDEAIVITLSSHLSGTYANAVTAAENYKDKIFPVDSMNACIGERLLGLYALRLIEQGLPAKEIVAKLEAAKSKINVIAVVDTLEYLKKGGRVSAAVAFAGELLSIKPVIGVIDGEVKVVGKALGSRKANNLLNTLVEKNGGIDFDMPYGVVWAGLNDSMLQKYLKDSTSLWKAHTENVPAYMIASTIGTHVGPGAVGVGFFSK